MTRRSCAAALAMLATLAVASLGLAAAPGADTILHCDFDAEPLDELIGEGGASVGQPVFRGGVPARVRDAPLPTPSLELVDDWGLGARHVRFEFLGGVGVTSGMLEVSMNLYFQELNFYSVYLREPAAAAVAFLSLTFAGGGTIHCADLDSPGGPPIGTYAAGVLLPLVLTFDLDARTYDLSLAGTLLRDDESLGPSTEGIGALHVGLDHDADSAGTMYVDDILVTATESPSAVASAGWGVVKAAWR
jgi:hypothetical protein